MRLVIDTTAQKLLKTQSRAGRIISSQELWSHRRLDFTLVAAHTVREGFHLLKLKSQKNIRGDKCKSY